MSRASGRLLIAGLCAGLLAGTLDAAAGDAARACRVQPLTTSQKFVIDGLESPGPTARILAMRLSPVPAHAGRHEHRFPSSAGLPSGEPGQRLSVHPVDLDRRHP